MSKQVVSVVVGLVFASGVLGQEVVSFLGIPGDDPICVAEVPASGLVITDVIIGDRIQTSSRVTISQILDDVEVVKVVFPLGGTSRDSYHLESGIQFDGGAALVVDSQFPSVALALCGYYPCPDPCQSAGVIPAVGSFGQTMLVLALVVAGSVLPRRRKVSPLEWLADRTVRGKKSVIMQARIPTVLAWILFIRALASCATQERRPASTAELAYGQTRWQAT